MAFDLDTAKARLTIAPADTTKDAALQLTLDSAMSIIETYCDRYFEYKEEIETFVHTKASYLQLKRYPIDRIGSIDGNYKDDYKIKKNSGILDFHGDKWFEETTVDYMGGYQVLPGDLEFVLWTIFDGMWPSFSGSGSAPAATGAIDSITIPDVGTIRYSSGSSSSSSGSVSSGGASNFLADIYGTTALILDKYRRPSC